MKNRKIIYLGLLFLLILALVLAGIIFSTRSQELKVIFLDVGQGDAILIEQGSTQILIDGGKSGQALLNKLGKYVPFWDRQIEAVIVTHPDQDHIGGLVDIFPAYQIKTIIRTNAQSDSQTFRALQEKIENEKAEVVEAEKDVLIKLSGGAQLQILFPFGSINPEQRDDSNAGSVVARLQWREDSFLSTGDLTMDQEAVLLAADGRNLFGGPLPGELKTRILKVGYHGSKYSTSPEFLDAVQPEEAVISVGKNSYGHPAPEIIERLQAKKIKIWRTDELGDIIYKCLNLDVRCRAIAN